MPRAAGETLTVVPAICSVTGRENCSTMAAVAASAASPPIGTLPSTTPSGTTAEVGGVSAVAGAANAKHSAKMKRRRLTRSEDPRVVADDSVGPHFDQLSSGIRVVDGPDVDTLAESVAGGDDRRGDDRPVQGRSVGIDRAQPARQPPR